MHHTVNDHALYVYTGGKAFDAHKPTVVFIHGVLNDHSVWILQSRYFANHGWNVLAVDLPGHGKSAGVAPQSVQDGAAAVWQLLDVLGVEQATLVGHSFGSLIALQAAADQPQRAVRLVLAGTAYPMRVSPALLESALSTPLAAIDLVNAFSHSTLAPPPSALGPGTWVYGGARALMRRVLASNTDTNLFYTGFKACDDYNAGTAAMAQVTCPTLFLLGRHDQMTPPSAAQSLIALKPSAQIITVDAGHDLMNEAPDATLAALQKFLAG